jgi:hypothetical protein
VQYYKNKVASQDAEKQFNQAYLTFANEVLYEIVPRLAMNVGEKSYGAESIGV